jgi:hypothetical protein
LLKEGVIDHREFKELRNVLKAKGSVTVGGQGGAAAAGDEAAAPMMPAAAAPVPAPVEAEEADEIPAPAPMPGMPTAEDAEDAERERSSSVADAGKRRASILAPAAPSGRSEGWLFKKGQGKSTFGRRNWKKRWCQLVQYLDDQQWYMEYYESEKDVPKQKYKGTVCMSGAEVSSVTNEKQPDNFFFDVVRSGPEGDLKHPFEILSLYAEDMAEGQAWVNTLQGVAGLAVPQPASARDQRATSAPADPLLQELD